MSIATATRPAAGTRVGAVDRGWRAAPRASVAPPGRRRCEARGRGNSARFPRTRFSPSRVSSARDVVGRASGKDDVPMAQRALSGFLELPAVPIGSYVSSPVSPFHGLDPRVKQAWLVALLLLPPNGTPEEKLCVCASLAALTALALPTRVWRPQLKSLIGLCLVLFLLTVVGADSVAPVIQPREPSGLDEGLLDLPPLADAYRYVLFSFGPAQITRKGVRLAVSSACLTFTVLQSAHLTLCTTTPEAMAAGLRWYLRPLRAARAPVDEIVFTLLLSLRFTSIVFEEVRNISLGLAARGIDWDALGWRGAANTFAALLSRALESLFVTADAVADAVAARGYTGAATHRLSAPGGASSRRRNPLRILPDAGALLLLGLFVSRFADEGSVLAKLF